MSLRVEICYECDLPAYHCARYGHLHTEHVFWCARRIAGGHGDCTCSTTIELAPNQPQRDPLPAIAEDLL